MAKGKYRRKRERLKRRQTLVQDSSISVRVITILQSAGIKNMAELDDCSEEDLRNIPGIGKAAIAEIQKERLASRLSANPSREER